MKGRRGAQIAHRVRRTAANSSATRRRGRAHGRRTSLRNARTVEICTGGVALLPRSEAGDRASRYGRRRGRRGGEAGRSSHRRVAAV